MATRPIALAALALAACSSEPTPLPANVDAGRAIAQRTVALAGGAPGIGFDDLHFAPSLGRVLAPGGRSGRLFLVDAATGRADAIEGFATSDKYEGGHDFGVTSADEGRGLVFATDRTSKRLVVADPSKRAIVATAALAADPDYVRFVAPRGELWVTEPDAEKIEIFALPREGSPTPVHAGEIAVRGGPESLVIDATHGRAYAHLWKGATVAIDVASRAIVATWPNGCTGSRGIELDEKGAFVFVGCAEGKAVTLDAQSGDVIGTAPTGNGVDVIAYAAGRRHLYVPAAKSATLTVLEVGPRGELREVASAPAAPGSHCAASDRAGHVVVCSPGAGALLAYDDAGTR